jgi:hypothetical protein
VNTLLTAANAAIQYNRGRQTGLVGLAGIGIAILIACFWDYLVPVFEYLGIVDLLDRNGLIFEGEGGLTGFILFSIAVRACIVFTVVGTILIAFGLLLSKIFSSEWAVKILVIPPLMLIAFPVVMFFVLKKVITTPRAVKKQLKNLRKERLEELQKPIVEVIKESYEILPKERALTRLDRLPTLGDSNFLLAITRKNDIYVVVPRVKGMFSGRHMSDEWPAEKLSIERNIDITKDLKLESSLKIERMIPPFARSDYRLDKLNKDDVKHYVVATDEVFSSMYSELASSQGFINYVNDEVNGYFERKENLQKQVANASTTEEFNQKVELLKEMNAYNEDIVRLMWESAKQEQ